MNLHYSDWLVIGSFMAFSLWIGLRYKNQASTGLSAFFLGGRNLPWYIAGTSMVATTFAADTPLAVTELVGQSGIAGNWLWWNFLLGGMLTTFFFAKLWRRAGILTDVELIELRYSGRAAAFLRMFRALYLGLFMNCLIIGWVNVALMSILEVFFEIGRGEQLLYVGIAMLVVMLYSSMSGLLGVAITDVVQFVIAITGCVILAVLVVSSEKIGGISGLKAQLPAWSLDFFPQIGATSAGGVAGTLTLSLGAFLAYTSVQWWASWYPGAEPGGGGYVAQRMMSAKNEKHALFATLFFQIAHYCIRPWPWILVGLCALVLYPELSMADKKLGFVMAMKDFLPNGLRGLLLVAFLAAYMSTISTQLNWGSSYLINDVYQRFINPDASNKKLVLASRLATIFLMLIALAVTTQITSISAVWSFIIECGAGLGLVLILRWYWWRINAWSEITATVAPFLAFAAIKIYAYVLQAPLRNTYPDGIPETVLAQFFAENPMLAFPNSFFITVAFTTISWILVTYLTRPTAQAKLESFYKLIEPQGRWRPVRNALGLPAPQGNIGSLLVCWISSVTMTYSVLFLIGDVIFQNWQRAGIWGASAGVSLAILLYFSNRIRIFD